jgi:hypothetical protein
MRQDHLKRETIARGSDHASHIGNVGGCGVVVHMDALHRIISLRKLRDGACPLQQRREMARITPQKDETWGTDTRETVNVPLNMTGRVDDVEAAVAKDVKGMREVSQQSPLRSSVVE